MKTIQLSKGQITKVDDEYFDLLNKYKWKATKIGNTYYATRSVYQPKGKYKTLMMHRIVLNVSDKNILVDHKDGDTLNNTKDNLRACNRSQNAANQKARTNCSSKYLGVSWNRPLCKWKVNIQKNSKNKHIGYYESEIDAALAYNEAAIYYHGEFARLNIIVDNECISHA